MAMAIASSFNEIDAPYRPAGYLPKKNKSVQVNNTFLPLISKDREDAL